MNVFMPRYLSWVIKISVWGRSIFRFGADRYFCLGVIDIPIFGLGYDHYFGLGYD